MLHKLQFNGRESADLYLKKHVGLDLSLVGGSELVGRFLEANKDRIEVRCSGEPEYVLKDRKLIFYYDFLCSGEIIESLRDNRDELVLGASDLHWFVRKLKDRQEIRKRLRVWLNNYNCVN